jgi:hypothetical protein
MPQTYLLKDIDDDVYARAKAKAAMERETIKTVLLRALEEYAKEEAKNDNV